MFFPLLPLVEDIATLESKPFIGLGGQLLINCCIPIEEVLEVARKYANVRFIAVTYEECSYTDDDVVQLLNHAITGLFLQDKELVNHLLEIGVPESRIYTIQGGNYVRMDGYMSKFSIDEVVPARDITISSFSDAIYKSLRTDREDGLFTTLVVDKYERCLGLVYSSKLSIMAAIEKKAGIYYSRSRKEIWVKGGSSGNTQKLLQISIDCDGDALKFVVIQESGKAGGQHFCHLETESCFGDFDHSLLKLEEVLKQRLQNAPEGSYTKRLFDNRELLDAKIKEEAEEVTTAVSKDELTWEVADLLYFVMTKMALNDVQLEDVIDNLHVKHMKITRRKGDAKEKFLPSKQASATESVHVDPALIQLQVTSSKDEKKLGEVLSRPIQKSADIGNLVIPIIEKVRSDGDRALIELTEKFDGVKLEVPVLKAPFPDEYFNGLSQEIKDALDLSMGNVRKFHEAQLQSDTLRIETQPGVVCSRFPRPIEKVGLYVPGGTAVLPSTAFMLGVPAQVAGCSEIIIASPPRRTDGKISPEVAYVASKIGASMILLAGGAQAVAALAYGTESVSKVDKILGPGNQFVTAAKMYIQNDTSALCSIDMPAGPSEVLVICDEQANPDFVAADLLSQAEHGIDSQVILIGVSLSEDKLARIQAAIHSQAMQLPRYDIIRECIKHSTAILCDTVEEGLQISNRYAPEHLIIQLENASSYLNLIQNAGSVFLGPYTPESCGDYSSGTNHTLPTYGYARQYSGVNTSTFQKFITAQEISPVGLQNIGHAVMSLAEVEGLGGHRNAVHIRMDKLGQLDN